MTGVSWLPSIAGKPLPESAGKQGVPAGVHDLVLPTRNLLDLEPPESPDHHTCSPERRHHGPPGESLRAGGLPAENDGSVILRGVGPRVSRGDDTRSLTRVGRRWHEGILAEPRERVKRLSLSVFGNLCGGFCPRVILGLVGSEPLALASRFIHTVIPPTGGNSLAVASLEFLDLDRGTSIGLEPLTGEKIFSHLSPDRLAMPTLSHNATPP